MEWLEFTRWSPEVQHALSRQAERLSATLPHDDAAPPHPTVQVMAGRLQALLRRHPPTNPWGHPPADA
jgi:hypothetical protein